MSSIFKDLKNYLRSLVIFLSCLLVRHPSSNPESVRYRQARMTDNYWNRVRYE
jgi:hypothetical protein